MRRALAIYILIAVSACSSARPPAVRPDLRIPERLAAADRLVRAGCYECLLDAYKEYDALRGTAAAEPRATQGAIRSGALVSMREFELGMLDSGLLKVAVDLAAQATPPNEQTTKILDVVAQMPRSITGVRGANQENEMLNRVRLLGPYKETFLPMLHDAAPVDELGAYTYTTLVCASYNTRRDGPLDEVFAPAAAMADTPLLMFRRSTCGTLDPDKLEPLLRDNPRFGEVNYLIGLVASGRRDLDGAAARYKQAYDWRPRWPSVTETLGNVTMTDEDFQTALRFYDETLDLVPAATQARLGRVKALTYLGKHEDAIAAVDPLLQGRWNLGEARYWRALNETDLKRYEEAWADIELAATLLINAAVPKLAGVIAYRRQQLEVSRGKFIEAYSRDKLDCETQFYLGIVHSDLRDWPAASKTLVETGACLESAITAYTNELVTIRASNETENRKNRMIARREKDIVNARRMLATSWFNVSVAYLNLAQKGEARQYAEKLVEDEEFGDRAREILSRVKH